MCYVRDKGLRKSEVDKMLVCPVPGGFELRQKECKASSLGMCRIQGIPGPEKSLVKARDNHDLPVNRKARPGATGQSRETGN